MFCVQYQRLGGILQQDNSGLGGGENLILPFDDHAIE
jgi:hypothetical protein